MSERALAEVDAPHSVRLPSERNSFVKKPPQNGETRDFFGSFGATQ